jgi:hypothetical protein
VVQRRNARRSPEVYPAATPETGIRFDQAPGGGEIVQSAHPRDIGALAFVVGVFLVLFIVSLMLGSPAR